MLRSFALGVQTLTTKALPLLAEQNRSILLQKSPLSYLFSGGNALFPKNSPSILASSRFDALSGPKIENLSPLVVPSRTVIKFSHNDGKRRTVKIVTKIYYRLAWGAWIRTMQGRNRCKWKKRASKLARSKQHVLCNSTQSFMLDKMVTNFWKRRKYYVDDPYEPYHSREEYFMTRRKPLDRSIYPDDKKS